MSVSMDFHLQLGRIQVESKHPNIERSSEEHDPASGGLETVIQIDENLSAREEEESCGTPKSEENRIPAARSPPPAPSKKRRRAPESSGKLKAGELEFFETVRGEEVEELFRSGFGFAKRSKSAGGIL